MKSPTCPAITAALATFLTASLGHAANPPRHTSDSTSPHPVAGVSVAITHEIPHLALAQAHQDLDLRLAQADPATVNVNHKTIASSGRLAAVNYAGPQNQPQPPLFILTRDLDAESQTQLQEDLLVMSRILDKAAQPEGTFNRGPRAMGIELVLGTGSNPARNLYIDGFGAVFMLNVGFPLLPATPTEDTDSNESKTETETIWEQTRQEMYGGLQSDASVLTFVGSPNIAEIQPYDQEQVETLRASLIDAVKNATNIRHLADNEHVMIYVSGAPIGGDQRVQIWRQESSSKDEQLVRELALAHRQATGADDSLKTTRAVMTIQASKNDIDRFARGELDLDQFRDRVRTHTYQTRASTDWHPNTFIWSNH
jgi:hypothetical protein